MATEISPLACIDPRAVIGTDVKIGPFCVVGPHVVIGDNNVLDSHVAIIGRTTIGQANRFWPNVVIGGEPLPARPGVLCASCSARKGLGQRRR